MRIVKADVYDLDLGERFGPMVYKGGRLREDRSNTTIVRVTTDTGIQGFGEVGGTKSFS